MKLYSTMDLLLAPFLEYRGALPASREEWKALAGELLREGYAAAGIDGEGSAERSVVIVETLRLVSGDENRTLALRAICYMRLLGVEERSFEEIGGEFGVTRQCVQEIYSEIQKLHPGMRSRGDKSEAYRQSCVRRRTGEKKVRPPWRAAKLWKLPPVQPL